MGGGPQSSRERPASKPTLASADATAGRQLPRLLQDCPGRRGRQRGGRGPGPSTKRDTRSGQDPTTVTATGEASARDTRTLGRRGKQHPARSLLLTGTSLEEEVCDVKMLLLLSRFSRVRLCATPYTAAHQAPPSLGFSRQEHWSGLPFPPAMHESEK